MAQRRLDIQFSPWQLRSEMLSPQRYLIDEEERQDDRHRISWVPSNPTRRRACNLQLQPSRACNRVGPARSGAHQFEAMICAESKNKTELESTQTLQTTENRWKPRSR